MYIRIQAWSGRTLAGEDPEHYEAHVDLLSRRITQVKIIQIPSGPSNAKHDPCLISGHSLVSWQFIILQPVSSAMH